MFKDWSEGEVLLIDKPTGWTSFDIVKKVRNAVGIKKVGHAGTLDPLASGLLIICTGRFTKKIDEYQDRQKEYEGSLVLGKTTPSFDLESEVDAVFDVSHITEAMIKEAAGSFVGEIEQVPPAFSAIKIEGKRAYEMAREGKDVTLKSRRVTVSKFEITDNRMPEIDFRIQCSKGTYIRSLVRDLGLKLNSGAYMSRLVRTAIGEFRLENAWQIDELIAAIKEQKTIKE